MDNKTQEALKMAIAMMEGLEVVFLHDVTKDNLLKTGTEKSIQACKEALAQPAIPKNCRPLDEYIAEMEKDPEIKQLLDIARKDVKKWSAQPAQEPVAYILRNEYNEYRLEPMDNLKITDFPVEVEVKLYTHPAPSWQGLKNVEISDIWNKLHENVDYVTNLEFARAIEQALKEKNT